MPYQYLISIDRNYGKVSINMRCFDKNTFKQI